MTRQERPRTAARYAALFALALAVSACYLPRADVQRDVSTFVLASVSQCSSESVGGAVRNDADVAVRMVLNAMWLDIASVVYHDVEHEIPRVEAESTVEWTILAGEDVDPPLLCTVEATVVEPLDE